MVSEQVLVKNFYRALAASAYVAGSAAAGLALGGPPGAAIATANATASLASPLGVAAVELAAQQATEYTIGSKAMADGGLITQPTFALLGGIWSRVSNPSGKKTSFKETTCNGQAPF